MEEICLSTVVLDLLDVRVFSNLSIITNTILVRCTFTSFLREQILVQRYVKVTRPTDKFAKETFSVCGNLSRRKRTLRLNGVSPEKRFQYWIHESGATRKRIPYDIYEAPLLAFAEGMYEYLERL